MDAMNVGINHTPMRWYGSPNLSWAGATAGLTSTVAVTVDGAVLWRDDASQILEVLAELTAWVETAQRTDFRYDEGIEGPLDEPLIIRSAGPDRWLIGSELPQTLQRVVSTTDLELAIRSFEREVVAEFEALTGIAFADWIRARAGQRP